jgi:hypothetical protein
MRKIDESKQTKESLENIEWDEDESESESDGDAETPSSKRPPQERGRGSKKQGESILERLGLARLTRSVSPGTKRRARRGKRRSNSLETGTRRMCKKDRSKQEFLETYDYDESTELTRDQKEALEILVDKFDSSSASRFSFF